MSDEELRGLIGERNKVGKTTSDIFSGQKSGEGHKLFKDLNDKHQRDLEAKKTIGNVNTVKNGMHWSPGYKPNDDNEKKSN